MISPEDESINLGPCCACGKEDNTVRNIMLLHLKASVPGSGWGCFQCGRPPDGAISVVCDECFESGKTILYVVKGFTDAKERILLTELTEPFDHDYCKHPETLGTGALA